MLEDLAKAIEKLRLPLDGTALTQVLALRDRLDALIAEAVGEFDAAQLWDIDSATSMTAWLRDKASMTSNAAHNLVSTASRLRKLPVTATAYRNGTLSKGQVEVILAKVDDATIDAFAEVEAELVPHLAPLGLSGCSRAMATWRDQVEEAKESPEPDRALHLSATLDGRHVLEGHRDAEGGAVVAAALALATVEDADRTPAQRRGDALVDVSRFFLDHQQTHTGGRARPHLSLVADVEAMEEGRGGRVVGGPALDGTTMSRILCDCSLHRVLTEGRSAILDYGTATRTIPANLWNALVIRDEHCRFPGCDRKSAWCEGHHVKWVTHGGATEINNLVLLCTRHHHRLHQPDWQAKLLPDATFEVTDPNGMVRASPRQGRSRGGDDSKMARAAIPSCDRRL
ncbi:MAG: hypothetical protein QOG82_1344 [Actinomycetota bacterium]|nr:hypothetical protein [Actinomycetota bacterium]